MKPLGTFAFIAFSILAGELHALSPEEVEQYRAGAGMGYAKAAELNQFPGPATERLMQTNKAGEYRLSHLETHWRMRSLLAEEQVHRYDMLRGHRKHR